MEYEDNKIRYYEEIKQEFINNEINRKVKNYSINKSDLETYYNVGKMLIDAQGGESRAKYGDNLIKEYSRRLTNELGKGYSERNLKNMRKFYLFQKGQPLAAKSINWTHYTILLSLKNIDEIYYYIGQITNRNLSKRQLQDAIKAKEYERLPESTKNKLINKEDISIEDSIKNPIIIRNNSNEIISEKVLQKLILEDIIGFMNELGVGYSFVGNEYKIKIGNSYNYIDLIFFNVNFNCYIVVELKITELRKEHIGQIEVYMNYIDNNLKSINHDKTIGIIICRKDNKFIMEYCSDKRILSRNYKII